MPTYTFRRADGTSIRITAETRTEAVRRYNARFEEENRRVLEDQGIDPDTTDTPMPIARRRAVLTNARVENNKSRNRNKKNPPVPDGGDPGDVTVTGDPQTTSVGDFDTKAALEGTGSGGSGLTIDTVRMLLQSTGQTARTQIGALGTLRDGASEMLNFGAGLIPASAAGRGYVTVNQALSEFQNLSEGQIRVWQEDLERAGFYQAGNTDYSDTYLRGVADELTLRAFSDFIDYTLIRGGFRDMSTATNVSNTGQTWRQLLDERIASRDARLAEEAAEDAASRGQGAAMEMPDPLMIRSVANQVAQLLMGQTLEGPALDDIVQRVNVGLLQADASGQDFDLQQNLSAWIKESNPMETQAQDLVNAYSTLTDLLGGMGQSAPRGGDASGINFT